MGCGSLACFETPAARAPHGSRRACGAPHPEVLILVPLKLYLILRSTSGHGPAVRLEGCTEPMQRTIATTLSSCRSVEHTSELTSRMRNTYSVFSLTKQNFAYST